MNKREQKALQRTWDEAWATLRRVWGTIEPAGDDEPYPEEGDQ